MTPLRLSFDPPSKRRRKSSMPRCASCGRRLSKYDEKSQRNHEISARSARHSVDAPTEIQPLTADGLAPARGGYGDNLVCSQVCGHVLAVRLVAALGIEVLQLLPPQWKHR